MKAGINIIGHKTCVLEMGGGVNWTDWAYNPKDACFVPANNGEAHSRTVTNNLNKRGISWIRHWLPPHKIFSKDYAVIKSAACADKTTIVMNNVPYVIIFSLALLTFFTGNLLNAKTCDFGLIQNGGFEFDDGQPSKYPLNWECQDKRGQFFLDPAVRKSGDRSLKLTASVTKYHVDQSVKIEPNTEYELSAWIRTFNTTGPVCLRVCENQGEVWLGEKYGHMIPPRHEGEWIPEKLKFVTSPNADRIIVMLYSMSDKGSVWFDDIALVKTGQAKTDVAERFSKPSCAESGRNEIANSSFEYSSVNVLPDYWGTFGWGICREPWISRLDDWRKNWFWDKTNAYNGKCSFRIYNPNDFQDDDLGLHSTVMELSAGSHVLSLYLKSDTDDFPVKLRFYAYGQGFPAEGTVTVKKGDWRRYAMDVFFKKTCLRGRLSIIPMKKGTLWIDAVQIEKGKKLTDYRPSAKDKGLSLLVADDKHTEGTVPEWNVPILSSPAKIDGNINEGCWQMAEKIPLALMDGKKISEATEALIARDEKNLYIAFKCFDSDIGNIKKNITAHDGPVWEDDCVEVFLDVYNTHTDYFQFAVNALNTKFDARSAARDYSWNPEWESAVRQFDKYWTTEIKIPFAAFGFSPAVNSVWGINLCRENHRKAEYSCSNPTYIDFHASALWGHIVLDKDLLSKYLWDIENPRLVERSSENRTLTAGIKNLTGSDRDISIKIKQGDFTKTKDLGLMRSGELKTLTVSGIKNTGSSKASVMSITVKDRLSGETLLGYSENILTVPVFESFAGYSYYSDENEMKIFNTVNMLRGATNEDIKLYNTLLSPSGTVVAEKIVSSPRQKEVISFDISNLENGEYNLVSKLYDGEKLVSSLEEPVTKTEKIAGETKTDREKRIAVADGAPFFPLGFFFPDIESMSQASRKGILRLMKNAGFNSVMYLAGPGFKDSMLSPVIKTFLDDCLETNLKALIFWGAGWREQKTFSDEDNKKTARAVAAVMKEFRTHPAIAAWLMIDEPFTHDKVEMSLPGEICKWAKKIDRNHLVYMNDVPRALGAVPFPGDIISIDYYPLPGENIVSVAREISKMRRICMGSRRPGWYWVQAHGNAWTIPRAPSAAEEECMVYSAVINGASGIFFFSDGLPADKSLCDTMMRLASELHALIPILISSESFALYSPPSPVQYIARKNNGKYYIIAVNTSSEETKAEFDLGSSTFVGSQIEVLFENRSFKADKKRKFSDVFKKYQRHVYVISEKERTVF